MEGYISHHPDGFAFVRPLMGKGEDIFVPPAEAARALDHDRVVVEVQRERDGRFSGRVVEVKERTRQLVIGVYQERGDKAWVEPREDELGQIRVPKTQLARPGDAVRVRLGVGAGLFGAGQELVGEVAGSLGSAADHSIEVLAVAYSKGFNDEFPPEVMDEADGFALTVAEAEATAEGRRDLRELPLVTIDGEDARDFDDAIFVEEMHDGWRLVVAIADVSHYVGEGSALDTEALRRATSVYLPGRVLPMLPERLSNGICSLKPDEDRLCMVADMAIDRQGQSTRAEVYPGVMRSAARCTYTEVHDVLAGRTVPQRMHLKPLFERIAALAARLTAMRRDRGAIDFDLPETRVELGPDGLPLRMVQRERWESHRLVEECMLAANEAVARYFRERGVPTVNRFHGEPDEERLATFLGLLGAYGIPVASERPTSKELNEVLKRLEGHKEQRALNQLALRSMMQAVYSSQNAGHYGLGAVDYLHFTSPIRRYPDLLVHRLLKQLWARGKGAPPVEGGERLEVLAIQSSERERAAMQVEREVTNFYACLLMKDRVGEVFAATVAGLSDNGFYVRLDEHHVEGLVKGETVYPDFEFDQPTYRLVYGDGRVVKVGQKLEVRLLSVNLKKKQMDYEVDRFIDELHEAPGQAARPEQAPARPGENKRRERGGGRGGSASHGREKGRGRGGGGAAWREKAGGGRGAGRSDAGTPRGAQGAAGGRPDFRRADAAGSPKAGGRGGQGKGQRDEGRGARTSARGKWEAPPQRREPPPAPRTEPREGGEARSFDPASVLDRLWRERGGRRPEQGSKKKRR